MQKPRTLLFALCSLPLLAQTPAAAPDSPFGRQADLASAEVRRISSLVETGALPRARLEQALAKLADAQDDLILLRTLYAPAESMTEEQTGEMVAAAQRRVDRQQEQIESVRGQIDAGIAARNALDPLNDELHFRRTTLELAQERARLLAELVAMARAEQNFESAAALNSVEQHFAGKGSFTADDLKDVEAAWQKQYDRPMPISANGDTAAHRALGFDHRGRVDVAVTPDQPEGIWLRRYLEAHNIPFFAFRSALPGKATGAHIHIGPGSVRLARLHEAG
jgi:murein DD-endopeptidase MepM/ murein hydrolase activator NlpD